MNNTKKTALTVILAFSAMQGFAQDARGAMNEILDGYTLPIFVAFMLAGIILGLVQQWDNMTRKTGEHAKKACLHLPGTWGMHYWQR